MKKIQRVYLPADIYDEIMRECARTRRGQSWLVQKAWLIAKSRIKEMPAAEYEEAPEPWRVNLVRKK